MSEAAEQADRAFPGLTLVLPGSWVQVGVQRADRVEQLLALVEPAWGAARTAALRADLDALRSHGGDQMLLNRSETMPMSLVTAWPQARPVTESEALLAELEGQGELAPVVHDHGYPMVRVRRAREDRLAAWGYWIAHPDSGRVLEIEVTAPAEVVTDEVLAAFDLVATAVRWQEDPWAIGWTPADEGAPR